MMGKIRGCNNILGKYKQKKLFVQKQISVGIADNHSKWKAYSCAVLVFGVGFLSAFFAASIFTSAKDSLADSNESTSSTTAGDYSLSVSATSAVDLDISVGENDTMTVSSGSVTVETTSPGYKLYLSMINDETTLSTSTGSTSATIAATSGTFTNPAALTSNTWGYALQKGATHVATDAGFSPNYSSLTSANPDETKLFAVPPAASATPQLIGSSTASTAGDNYTIYYGVRANSSTNPGAYSNNIAFTAVADAGTTESMTLTPSTIDPDTVTTITVATTMYSTATNLDATITMTDSSSTSTTLTCTKTSSTPLTYSCDVPATTAGNYTVTLSSSRYSKTYTASLEVVKPVPTSLFDLTTMQELADYPQLCTQATTPLNTATLEDIDGSHHGDTNYVPTVTLLDDRTDGASGTKHSYRIRKLADGNCWMTENLALVGPFTPSSDDSDVKSTSEFALTSSNTGTWCVNSDSSCMDKSMVINTGTTYGVLYNWYAATAGTGTFSLTSGNAESSICPKGWRLPTGGSSGEFQTLYSQYNSTDKMRSNGDYANLKGPAFVLSGYRRDSNTSDRGSGGHYWSSTASTNSSYVYYLNLTSSNVLPANINRKDYGLSVRCVADETMQDMTPAIAASMSVGESKTLRDTRDNNTYTVRKLADGKVWMTQNLRLQNKTLTSDDSNLTTISSYSLPASSTSNWCTTTGRSCTNRQNVLDATDTSISGQGSAQSNYGMYYSWAAAIASDTAYNASSGEAPNSICPKGWRLPTGGSSGEFQTLYGYYGSSADMQSATGPGFVLSGSRNGSSTNGQGSYGNYWSRTASGNNYAYNLHLDSSDVYLASSSNKYYGFSVRCVAKGLTLDDISTMQEMTPEIAIETAIGASKTLTDTRDGSTYTVKKLNDGKIWMTQNLALQGRTISSTDSNLPSGKTVDIPASSTDKWCTTNSSACDDQLMTLDATDKNIPNQGSADPTWGVYYNWYTATATYGTYSKTSGTVSYDICPKGWRLPTGGSSGEFQTLYGYYGSSANMQSVTGPAFVLSGLRNGGSTNYQDGNGFYWSSTALNDSNVYSLSVNSSNVYPANYNDKYVGFSVRCVAQ